GRAHALGTARTRGSREARVSRRGRAPPARRTRTAEARRTPPPRACRGRGRKRRGQARVSGWDAASALQGEVSIKDSATPRFVTAARRWHGSLRLTAP